VGFILSRRISRTDILTSRRAFEFILVDVDGCLDLHCDWR
jgi:hypothetical protein